MTSTDSGRFRGVVFEPLRALWSEGRGIVLLAVSVGWLVSIGVRLVYPALLPSIRADLEFDLTAAGLVVTVLWACYALMQFPGGLLADRIGERAVLTASTALTGVGIGIVVLSSGAVSFFFGTVATGFGSGLYATTRATVLSDIYPERSGTAMGFIQAFGNVGTTVLPPIAGFLTVLVSWRLGIGFLLPIVVVVVIALWLVVPARTSGGDSVVERLSWETIEQLKRGLGNRTVLLVTVSMFLVSVVYQSFTGFYPTYLVLEKGFSEGRAALLYGGFFAVGIVLQLVSGSSGDTIGMRWTLIAALAAATVGLALLPFAEGLPVILLLSGLLSAQLAFWPVVNAYTIEVMPDEMQGTGFGLVRTVYLFSASSGPVIIGWFGDAGMFDTAFLLLAVIAAIALVLCRSLPEP
jgi:MFS family permease